MPKANLRGTKTMTAHITSRVFMVTEVCTISNSNGDLVCTEPDIKFKHRSTGVVGGFRDSSDVFGMFGNIRAKLQEVCRLAFTFFCSAGE